jgi:hypothetical protein
MTKFSNLLTAAIILGSASIASAATVTHAAKHQHAERGSVLLLEDHGARAAGAGTAAAENFQDNWNVGY